MEFSIHYSLGDNRHATDGGIEVLALQKCLIVATALYLSVASPGTARLPAQDEFDREPINYSAATPENCASRLEARLEVGEAKLEYDERLGYLPSILKELAVPVSSQMLVFTKTSLQRQRIAPRTPRAIYFNDEAYIGFCQKGDVMEISAVDPKLGTVFYTLDQKPAEKPRLIRQGDSCLICHASNNTLGVPGHVVRSVFSDRGGYPILSSGTYRIDHTSPLETRWGGWYVTGTHGNQKHLGNCTFTERDEKRTPDPKTAFNVTDLSDRFDCSRYLSPHSDIVALMVLEHQTQTHNYLTKANFVAQQAMHAQRQLNKELGQPLDQHWESTTSRIRSAGDPLVRYLLMCDEAPLTGKLTGTTSFATEFSAKGPRDSKGRSLRDLDLEKRLFRYPCSYLIYSPSFAQLPPEMSEYVLQRMYDILSGTGKSEEFAHLSAEDRRAILEILRETMPSLPGYWHNEAPAG